MPYIICVNQPGYLPEAEPTAVATLEEMRETASGAIGDAYIRGELPLDAEWAAFHDRVNDLPESGGTIGPLPDGYVIDVQKVSGYALLQLLPTELRPHRDRTRDETDGQYVARILDAYNTH